MHSGTAAELSADPALEGAYLGQRWISEANIDVKAAMALDLVLKSATP